MAAAVSADPAALAALQAERQQQLQLLSGMPAAPVAVAPAPAAVGHAAGFCAAAGLVSAEPSAKRQAGESENSPFDEATTAMVRRRTGGLAVARAARRVLGTRLRRTLARAPRPRASRKE